MVNLRVGMLFDNIDASVFVNNLLNSHPLLSIQHTNPGRSALLRGHVPAAHRGRDGDVQVLTSANRSRATRGAATAVS